MIDDAVAGRMFAVVAGLAFAFASLATRQGLRTSTTATGVLISFAVNAVAFAIWVTAVEGWRDLSWAATGWLVAAGIMAPALARTFAYSSMAGIGASVSVPIVASEPIFAAIFGGLAFAAPIEARSWLGIIVIVSGVALLSFQNAQRGAHSGMSAASAGLRHSRFVVLALIAAACYGMAMNLRHVGLALDVRPLVGAGVGAIVALISFPVIARFTGMKRSHFVLDANSAIWFGLAATSLVFASYFLYAALALVPAAIASALTSVRVPLVVLFGVLFLRKVEHVTPAIVAGAVLVFVGVLAT